MESPYRDRLRLARARHRHTVVEAAKAAGIGRSTWKNAETRGVLPKHADVLGRLARYCAIDPAVLIGGGASVADAPRQAGSATGASAVPDARAALLEPVHG